MTLYLECRLKTVLNSDFFLCERFLKLFGGYFRGLGGGGGRGNNFVIKMPLISKLPQGNI